MATNDLNEMRDAVEEESADEFEHVKVPDISGFLS
jgi:hypothetical protein